MKLLKVECLLMLFCFTTGLSACGGDEDEPIKDDVPIPELYGPKHGTGNIRMIIIFKSPGI